MKRELVVLGVMMCAGCDGGGASSSSCALAASLSGAVTWTSDADPACGIQSGGRAGVFMGFYLPEGEVERFVVEVEDVKEGQTGTFPASVEVKLRDGRAFETASCTVRIDEHTLEKEEPPSRAYLMGGSGACTGPAAPKAGSGAGATVAPFTFRFPPRWF